METCIFFDEVTALHILEEISHSVLVAALALVLTAIAIHVAACACIWPRWLLDKPCPILEDPIEECGHDRGSLVTCKDCFISRENRDDLVIPVQQSSTDKGDLVFST